MDKYKIQYYSKAEEGGKRIFYPVFTEEQQQHEEKLKQLKPKKSIKSNKVAVTIGNEDYRVGNVAQPLKGKIPKEVSRNAEIKRQQDEKKFQEFFKNRNIKDNPTNRKKYKDIILLGSGLTNIKFIGFEKGKYPKKYNAILEENGKIKKIGFGHQNYEQYKDTTGLNLYSHLDHLNKKRRELYFKRHNKNYPKYSADWFSKNFLW